MRRNGTLKTFFLVFLIEKTHEIEKVAHHFRLFCPKRKAEDILLLVLSSFLKYVSYYHVCFKKCTVKTQIFFTDTLYNSKIILQRSVAFEQM